MARARTELRTSACRDGLMVTTCKTFPMRRGFSLVPDINSLVNVLPNKRAKQLQNLSSVSTRFVDYSQI